MGGGIEKGKDALAEEVHHTIAEINRFDQWDLPAKLIASIPQRLAAAKLVKEKHTRY